MNGMPTDLDHIEIHTQPHDTRVICETSLSTSVSYVLSNIRKTEKPFTSHKGQYKKIPTHYSCKGIAQCSGGVVVSQHNRHECTEAWVQVQVEGINLLNDYLSSHLPFAQLKSISIEKDISMTVWH